MGGKRLLRSVAAVLFWLLLWQLGAMAVNRGLLIAVPTPLRTAGALLRLAVQKSFWAAVVLSLGRILLGFSAAVLAGVLLAAASSAGRVFAALGAPLLKILRAIPVASFTLLVFLWVPRDRIPTVISFLTVLPVVWSNAEKGLLAMDRQLWEMGKIMGLSPLKILREIRWPALWPYLQAAITTGLGFAWKSGVAAEVICRTGSSLGNWLWLEKNAVEYEGVFAVTAVIVLLSVALEGLVRLVMKGERA